MNSKIVRMFLVLSILIAAILIAMIGTVPAKAAPRPAAPMMTNFAIYSITASCNGSGKVYFFGSNPGFTLTVMDKHLGASGPFVSSGITITIPAGGSSPISYQFDLSGWTGGPHYRVDSNRNTKSASLYCEGDDITPTASNTATNTATLTPTNTATNTPTNTATATEVQCDWLNQELINGECVDFTPTPTDTSVPTVTNTATDTAVPVCTEQGEPQYSVWSPYIPDPNDPTHLIRWRTYVVYDLYDTEHVCDSGIEWDDPILAPTPTGTPIVEVTMTPGVPHEGQGCVTYRPEFIAKLMEKGIYDPAAYYPQLNKICPPPSAGKNPLEGTVVTRMGALK